MQLKNQLAPLIKISALVVIILLAVWFIGLQNTNPVVEDEQPNNSNMTPTPSPPPSVTPPATPTPSPPTTPAPTPTPRPIPTPPENTFPEDHATVKIGSRSFSFDPTQVQTTRPDVFKPGFFSVFDVLVQLHNQGDIELVYHFDEDMNTHIIDSINQETDWWYQIYYSGGWSERNVFRPDHYPWKDQSTLTFFKETRSRITRIYAEWEQEVLRKTNNKAVIIPEVEIRSQTFRQTFENVTVTAHNLRNDIFQEGTITAIDVILSLADQGKITYELQYYESMGSANVVKSYWVESINQDVAYGRCGYVYEAGSTEFMFSSGNHIHLPSDTRVLNSPEYVDYFWICI